MRTVKVCVPLGRDPWGPWAVYNWHLAYHSARPGVQGADHCAMLGMSPCFSRCCANSFLVLRCVDNIRKKIQLNPTDQKKDPSRREDDSCMKVAPNDQIWTLVVLVL